VTTIFVSSSGTEIGKTFVTELLLTQLKATGHACRALKPIVSGIDEAHVASSDPGRLLAAMGLPLNGENLDAISPWRFRAPLSPDMAAAREGRKIDYDALLRYCRAAQGSDILLVEGVGGVMAPLTEHRTVRDWIADLDVPVLLVVGSYLGSISHTLTAASALESAGAALAGLVVNQSDDEPVDTHETAATIRRFLPQSPCLVLPKKKAGADFAAPDLVGLISVYLNRS